MKEKTCIEICNQWISKGFYRETNKNCSPLIAFDWIEENGKSFIVDFNTNIDLTDSIIDTFLFEELLRFLKKNQFSNVLGIRNTGYLNNPSRGWTSKLKQVLDEADIEYDEYLVGRWPEPMPDFEVNDDLFMLRYSFDEYSPIDKFASSNNMFANFISRTNHSNNFKLMDDFTGVQKSRVIVLCSDIESILLHEPYDFRPK